MVINWVLYYLLLSQNGIMFESTIKFKEIFPFMLLIRDCPMFVSILHHSCINLMFMHQKTMHVTCAVRVTYTHSMLYMGTKKHAPTNHVIGACIRKTSSLLLSPFPFSSGLKTVHGKLLKYLFSDYHMDDTWMTDVLMLYCPRQSPVSQ